MRPGIVCRNQKPNILQTSKAAIDATLSKLQNIEIMSLESVIEYISRIEKPNIELQAVGHPVVDLKKVSVLRGMTAQFSVAAQVIKTTGKSFKEAISYLIVAESAFPKKSTAKASLTIEKKNGTIRICSYCGQDGHSVEDCCHNLRSKS